MHSKTVMAFNASVSRLFYLSVAIAVLALTGCGGGGSSSTNSGAAITLGTTAQTIYADGPGIAVIHFSLTGQLPTDVLHCLFVGIDNPFTVGTITGGQFILPFPIDPTVFFPSDFKCYVTGSGGRQSNTVWIAFLGNRMRQLATSSTEAYYLPGQDMSPQIFTLANGSANGAWGGNGIWSVAYDNSTQQFVENQLWELGWINQALTAGGDASTTTTPLIACAADNGIGFATAWSFGLIESAPLLSGNQSLTTAAAGTAPWAIAAGTWNGNHLVAVYDRQGTSVLLFNSNLTQIGAVDPTGIATASSLAGTINGGWQIALFTSGPKAGTIALLSLNEKLLVSMAINPTTLIPTETARLTLTGVPTGFSKDEANGKVRIAFANVTNGGSTFASVDLTAATLSQTPMTATTPWFAADAVVSADGKTLYVAGMDQNTGGPVFLVLPNN